jgi:hypothetical protein
MAKINVTSVDVQANVLTAELQLNDAGILNLENPLAAACEQLNVVFGATSVSLNNGVALVPGVYTFQFSLNGEATFLAVNASDPSNITSSAMAAPLIDVGANLPQDSTFKAFWDGLNDGIVAAVFDIALASWATDNTVALMSVTTVLIASVAVAPLTGGAVLGAAMDAGLPAQVFTLLSDLVADFVKAAADAELKAGQLTAAQATELENWAASGNLLVQLGSVSGESWEILFNDLATLGAYVYDNSPAVKLMINYHKDLVGKFSMILKIVKK